MHPGKADRSLQDALTWALSRMKDKGYTVKATVSISVDPAMRIMGYARKEGEGHAIVISEWALDSEMLGGLLLHELSHIYFTEQGAHSHDGELLEEILQGMKEREGLRAKEMEYLVDAFNHLQNVIVDDVVFDVMGEREREQAKRFFAEWVSEKPSGDPVLDTALLCRNAFAVASLSRRKLFDPGSDMGRKNRAFVTLLGESAAGEFEWLEGFLERASNGWTEAEYRQAMDSYFERVISMMRSSSRMGDLR